MKKEIISLGAFKNKQDGKIGTLNMIVAVHFVANVPCNSVHYKMIIDGTNENRLVHEEDGLLYDTLNNEWEKC